MTQVGATLLGIIVDRVFDTEEIVVKPVAPILRHITMFSGNTILGDGSVIMILDPNGIARATGAGTGGDSRAGAAVPVEAAQHSNERTAMLLFRAGDATRRRWRCRSAWSRGSRIFRANGSRRSGGAAGHPVPRPADAAGAAVGRGRSGPRAAARCWCSPTATAAWA